MHLKKLFFVLAAALVLSGCSAEKPAEQTVRREITGVRAAEAKKTETMRRIELSGTVKARSRSVVASKVMGAIRSIEVREGDPVKKGDLLLTIEARETGQKVKAAEAGRNEALKALMQASHSKLLAQRTYKRYKRLYEENAVSRHEFETIEAQKHAAELEFERMEEAVKRAKAGLDEAIVYKDYTRINSPVTGIVSSKMADAGSMAIPGTPLLVIDDTSSFTLDVMADESLAGELETGGAVDVSIDSLGVEIEGTVLEAVKSIDPATRSFLVRIGLSHKGLRPGLYARASLASGKREAVMLPEGAIVEKGSLTGVWAVDKNGVVTYRLIRKGGKDGAMVEILSGLNPGERVIVEGAEKAFDGGVIRDFK